MAAEAGLVMKTERERTSYSRLALEAQDWAKDHGDVDAFHHAAFDAYWRDGRDIGAVDVVLDIAKSVGMDPEALRPVLEGRTLQGKVEQEIDQARMLNIHAVPTFILDQKWAIEGAQPYALFQRVMQEHVKAERKSG
jgi:predicted DsbA family dithiol-disulfide isomerase